MIYRTCPICGANLDPGERCDCNEYQNAATRSNSQQIAAQKRSRSGAATPERQGGKGYDSLISTSYFT